MQPQYRSVSEAGFKIHCPDAIPFSEKKLTETQKTIYTEDRAIFALKNDDIWQHCWFKVLDIPFPPSI